jgi:hypothetical protein
MDLYLGIFDWLKFALKVTVKLYQGHTAIPRCHVAYYLQIAFDPGEVEFYGVAKYLDIKIIGA